MNMSQGQKVVSNSISGKALNEKQDAAQRFKNFGGQIRDLVSERQRLNIKIEKIGIDVAGLEEGDKGLEHLLAAQDSSLAFLELDMEWDPQKVKNQMMSFHDLIAQNKHKFRQAPIGPLYLSVAVKSRLWHTIAEKILTPHFCTFVVNCELDQMALQDLVDTFRGGPWNLEQLAESPLKINILVVPFVVKFDPRPRPRVIERLSFSCTNVLDTLKFKEEESNTWKIAVGKLLNAENIFLFQTEHDAFIFMHAQASLHPHVKVLAYSLDGYQIFPFPEFKTASFRIPKRVSFLTLDRSDDIQFMKATLTELEENRKLYDKAINNLRELQFKALDDWEKVPDLNNTNQEA